MGQRRAPRCAAVVVVVVAALQLLVAESFAPPSEFGRLLTDGAAAIFGGSMGVMGTLAVYERNRFKAKQRQVCAYCEGTGFLKCAHCVGSGVVAGEPCPVCQGAQKHVCVNCEATGLAIPAAFERKEVKAQDDELERKLDEIGIAALADDIIRAENQPGDILDVSRMLQRRALAKVGDEEAKRGDRDSKR